MALGAQAGAGGRPRAHLMMGAVTAAAGVTSRSACRKARRQCRIARVRSAWACAQPHRLVGNPRVFY